jgi:hypothetical protein
MVGTIRNAITGEPLAPATPRRRAPGTSSMQPVIPGAPRAAMTTDPTPRGWVAANAQAGPSRRPAALEGSLFVTDSSPAGPSALVTTPPGPAVTPDATITRSANRKRNRPRNRKGKAKGGKGKGKAPATKRQKTGDGSRSGDSAGGGDEEGSSDEEPIVRAPVPPGNVGRVPRRAASAARQAITETSLARLGQFSDADADADHAETAPGAGDIDFASSPPALVDEHVPDMAPGTALPTNREVDAAYARQESESEDAEGLPDYDPADCQLDLSEPPVDAEEAPVAHPCFKCIRTAVKRVQGTDTMLAINCVMGANASTKCRQCVGRGKRCTTVPSGMYGDYLDALEAYAYLRTFDHEDAVHRRLAPCFGRVLTNLFHNLDGVLRQHSSHHRIQGEAIPPAAATAAYEACVAQWRAHHDRRLEARGHLATASPSQRALRLSGEQAGGAA